MKTIGLDGKEYSWSPSSSALADEGRSKLHLKARKLLNEMFPYDIILEDVTLPGTKNARRKSLLIADLFLPARNLMVEVNGEQHTKHITYYHKTKHEFLKAQLRDREKIEWCDINDISLVILNFDQDVEEWRRLINER